MLLKRFEGPRESSVDQLFHFVVDLLRGHLAVRLGQRHVGLTGRIVEAAVAQLLAHAVIGHHRIGLLGHTLQIVQRTGRHHAEIH